MIEYAFEVRNKIVSADHIVVFGPRFKIAVDAHSIEEAQAHVERLVMDQQNIGSMKLIYTREYKEKG